MDLSTRSSFLSRREALRLFSGTALALMVGRLHAAETSPTPNFSLLTPELTEGPYYIDLERIRKDITEGKPGVPLRLRIRVAHLTTGAPIPGAAVDVWHCDAQGVYSGFGNHPPGPPPGGPDNGDDMGGFFGPPPAGGGPGPGGIHKPENNQTFLRGVQLTDKTGLAELDSIFPGWYQGRTTHIHVRVHIGGMTKDGKYQGGHISHTGQIFYADDITTQIYQLPAYAKNQQGRMLLSSDGIYQSQVGQPLAKLSPVNTQKPELGFFSDSILVVDPKATPQRA